MIRVENLSMRLGNFALLDVNLQVQRGEHSIILGPMGSGKTTLLKCIAGIYRPDSGRIEMDGEDVTELPPERRNIGYVPQDYRLFPHLTVGENISFGLRVRRSDDLEDRTKAMIDLVGLSDLSRQCIKCLSEGQKQLVALARALAIQPRVLLLDEPFARLDSAAKVKLQGELKRIHEQTGATIIHATHDFEGSLGLGNRVSIMNDGRLVHDLSEMKKYLDEKLGYIPIDLRAGD